jgi:hypothetical protein
VEPTLSHLVIELVEYVVEPDHLLGLVISIVRVLDLLVPLVALGQHQLDIFFPDVKNVKKLLSALSLFLRIAFSRSFRGLRCQRLPLYPLEESKGSLYQEGIMRMDQDDVRRRFCVPAHVHVTACLYGSKMG